MYSLAVSAISPTPSRPFTSMNLASICSPESSVRKRRETRSKPRASLSTALTAHNRFPRTRERRPPRSSCRNLTRRTNKYRPAAMDRRLWFAFLEDDLSLPLPSAEIACCVSLIFSWPVQLSSLGSTREFPPANILFDRSTTQIFQIVRNFLRRKRVLREKCTLAFFLKSAIFLYRKCANLRKQVMQTESQFAQQVAAKLETQRDLFEPLEVLRFNVEPRRTGSDYAPDATLELGWKGRIERFQVEIKSRTAPSLIQAAISKLERYGQTGPNLMLLVPYLSKTITQMVTPTQFSCVDLNGNYLIETNDWLAIRLDMKNQFTESGYIKKIFEGNSSLACRLMLRENKVFSRVSQIYDGIRALGGNLSLSAVSKVLTALDEKLFIDRSKTSIRLLQPRRLLEELRTNYKAPKTRASVKLKLPEGRNSPADSERSLRQREMDMDRREFGGALRCDHSSNQSIRLYQILWQATGRSKRT